MSASYPDLNLTNFPENIDTFMQWLNITATDGPLIAQYQSAMEAGNTTLANQILSQIPSGTQKIIKATDLNQLTQALLAVERFYLTDIQPYIENQQENWLSVINQFDYKGVWSNGTSYEVNNLVTYTVSGLTLVYIATSTPPVGTVPTNTVYWRLLTIQGQQGISGQGLSYRQEWNVPANYQVNDSVTYNNALWMAIQPSVAQTPGDGSAYWQKVMNLEVTTYPIQDTQPENQTVNSLWLNTSDSPTDYYYLEPLTNPIEANMIPIGYQTYDAQGQVLDGQGPLPIVSGGTDAIDSQNALNNLGAGVRSNLLDNAYFIGGGSQQGGGQFPINQKGQTTYSNGTAFDRWYITTSNGNLSIEPDGVLINQTLSSWFSQNIQNPSQYANKTMTFSILVQAINSGILRIAIGDSLNTGDFGSGSVLDTQFNVGEIKLLTLTKTIQNGCSVVLSQALTPGGMTYKCFSAKLEIGNNQTLAYQKSDGSWELFLQPKNDYITQLLKCQYYSISFGKDLDYESVGFGEATSETSIMVVVPVPVALRIKPTAMLTGTLNLRSGNQILECTSLSFDAFSPSTVFINAGVTGANPGAAYDAFLSPGSSLILDCSI